MASYTTERIWTMQNDLLLPREGKVRLEPDHRFVNDSDTLGPLHVATGLLVADQAVFLSIRPNKQELKKQELSEQSVGYLVTHVDPDGSGILVSGELFDRNPKDWLTDRLVGAWQSLSGEGYSPREFGLDALAAYFSRRGIIEE